MDMSASLILFHSYYLTSPDATLASAFLAALVFFLVKSKQKAKRLSNSHTDYSFSWKETSKQTGHGLAFPVCHKCTFNLIQLTIPNWKYSNMLISVDYNGPFLHQLFQIGLFNTVVV